MFENIITNIIALLILLYMAIAVYMRRTGQGLAEIIGEIKSGMKK